MSLVKFITHGMPKSSLFLLFMPIFHRIFFTGNAAIRRRMVFLLKIPISFSSICHRVCLKNHSRNLHAPLCGIFHPNSVAVARYGALIRAKYPTNCDAHLAESLFQTHSNVTSIPHIFITHSYYRIKLILTTVSQDNLSISKRRKVILICIINLCYINVNPV